MRENKPKTESRTMKGFNAGMLISAGCMCLAEDIIGRDILFKYWIDWKIGIWIYIPGIIIGFLSLYGSYRAEKDGK